jgi:hypothetical protein
MRDPGQGGLKSRPGQDEVRWVRVPRSRALLYAAVLNLALVVTAVGRHHWVSAALWLGLTVVIGMAAYRRPRTVALDPYDFRVQVRLGPRYAAGIAVWGAALLFAGPRGPRGRIEMSDILTASPFFAVGLALLALSLFWGTPRGQRRLLLLRERAAAKQAKADAAAPTEPPEPAAWISPPYFDN